MPGRIRGVALLIACAVGSLPGARDVRRLAEGAPGARAGQAATSGAVLALLVAVGHRPAQLRRRSGDRRRVRARRGGARHAADHRLHPAQHHRGVGDRGPDCEVASVAAHAGVRSGDRRGADDCRRVVRRAGVFAGPRGGVSRARRGCDCAGDRADHRADHRGIPAITRLASAPILLGLLAGLRRDVRHRNDGGVGWASGICGSRDPWLGLRGRQLHAWSAPDAGQRRDAEAVR